MRSTAVNGALDEFRIYTERRATAITLAVRLYAADHGGTLPARLGDLKPVYLSQIPVDPFAPDERELRYILSPRPVVYSISENGIDDGGDDTGAAETNIWAFLDAVFPLAPPGR